MYLRALLNLVWRGTSYYHAKLRVNEYSILQQLKSELSEEDKSFYGYFEDHIELAEIT